MFRNVWKWILIAALTVSPTMGFAEVDMEMLQTLEIAHPITLPAHISHQFTEDGIIQFEPGTVTMDKKINGFYIPVTIR